jgi:2-amino-4-hydroxy-6-hydroxymethyldihydropteridine diphosphokinase
MRTAFLGLGSNLGDRQTQLAGAARGLTADPAITLVRASAVYETRPVGREDQPDFLNQVLQIATTHEPRELLAACLAVEQRLGRVRRERWGPRVIDIDVLLYAGLSWNDDNLVLPHPRMHERGFVLTPLAELVPDLLVNGVTVRELAARVGTAGLGRAERAAALSEGVGREVAQ